MVSKVQREQNSCYTHRNPDEMVLEGEAGWVAGSHLGPGNVMRSQLLSLSLPLFIRTTRFSLFCEVKGAIVGILEP